MARGCEESVVPALDEQGRDVVPRQLDRGGEAGRAGADHQDGGLLWSGEGMGVIVERTASAH